MIEMYLQKHSFSNFTRCSCACVRLTGDVGVQGAVQGSSFSIPASSAVPGAEAGVSGD